MKKQFMVFFSVALLGLAGRQARAAVVVSNDDPANYSAATDVRDPQIGQALLLSNRPVSLTSVTFPETSGVISGQTFAVYSRNADGTLGTAVFSGFTAGFDSTTNMTTETVTGTFTLQANTGYWFVLSSPSSANVNWNYANTTDYAASFGATLPATKTSFGGSSTSGYTYFDLNQFPQVIQVNGSALPAVPEPSALAFIVLTLAGGVTALARQRRLAL